MWSSVPEAATPSPHLSQRVLLVVGVELDLEHAEIVRLAGHGIIRERLGEPLAALEVLRRAPVHQEHSNPVSLGHA